MNCWACGNDVDESSIYCVKCEKWQNWRKWLDFSSLNLSLLIALVSVIGATIPPLVNALGSKEPEFLVTFIDAKSRRFELVVLNKGEAPGALRNKVICNGVFSLNGNIVSFSEKFVQRGGSTTTDSKGIFPFIMPGDIFEVDFEFARKLNAKPNASGKPRCTLKYDAGNSEVDAIVIDVPTEYVETIFYRN